MTERKPYAITVQDLVTRGRDDIPAELVIKQYSGLLYDQALLVEGILPEDPVAFAAAVCNLM